MLQQLFHSLKADVPKDHITPIETTSKEIKVALIDLKKKKYN